jgi:ATP-dependent DNA helicase RecG
VEFQKIGLVIVDEQHRFGVEQRREIKERSLDKTVVPHFLSMTATPIPRSFALALYGDLDLSLIQELPPGRKPIKTRLVEPRNREKAYQFIHEQIKQGRQAFVICPLIELGEEDRNRAAGGLILDEKKTVLDEYEKLSKKIFPDLRVGFLHGKLKAKEKNETMSKFAAGELDILVSTSVVEVGVNIPNASVIIIEGAERFGLAQLHQFRGRVGRSNHQSYCLLFTDTDSQKAKERLDVKRNR